MASILPSTVVVDLAWEGGLRFSGTSEQAKIVLNGPGNPEPTPVQALAFSLGACMGIDLVQMLTKGRHDLKDLRAHLVGERPEEPPKYFQKIHLHFTLKGDIPPEAVDRAIALSHEKHCSVWASLRQDIEFRTSYEIIRG